MTAFEEPSDGPALMMAIAREVAQDRSQRAVPLAFRNPDELEHFRRRARDTLASTPEVDGVSVANVQIWTWTRESTGEPLSDVGRKTGFELRLSYYESPAERRVASFGQREGMGILGDERLCATCGLIKHVAQFDEVPGQCHDCG